MKIFLTFDYELYFGSSSGTLAKCMLEPTERLMKIAETHQVKMTFFIDCGYLIALQKYKGSFPELEKDYTAVSAQIKRLTGLGHDCQLHIHPHWEDTVYDGKKWVPDVRRYKLSDFSEEEILTIFKKYKAILESITNQPSRVYRAGGWCLQPFSKIRKAFEETGMKMDSTVFHKGYLKNDTHYFDFRTAPAKDHWRFTEDLCVEEADGKFMEIPISAHRYSPLFFWRLYGLGRLFPAQHKGFGDGAAIPSKGMKVNYLTRYQQLPVSSDGYFASALAKSKKALQRSGAENMVVIGHPKASTHFSLKTLEDFIKKEKTDHQFLPLSSQLIF